MADSPTPRSYRLPALTAEGGRSSDTLKEELRDITTLLLELRIQIKQLRSEVEELKVVEENKPAKSSLIPPSVRGAVTTKRAVIASLVLILTQLPELLDLIQGQLEKMAK
jgi:hypothetical protein